MKIWEGKSQNVSHGEEIRAKVIQFNIRTIKKNDKLELIRLN